MKILQITHKPPVPSVDGGCLAMRQITSCLQTAGIMVKVFSAATDKHPIIDSDEFHNYKNKTDFESVYVNTKTTFSKIVSSFFKRSSLQADRFFTKKMNRDLETILLMERFDVVILESVFVGNYIDTIRKYSHARIILRVHNIEHLIWKRLKKQTKNPIKKVIYGYLAHSLKRFELSLFKKIDGYLPITDVDHNFFKEQFPHLGSKTIPFCIDLSDYQYKEKKIEENHITLFHIGSMNWQPNIEGMSWFLEDIWKKIADKYPQLSLVLAGKGNKTFFNDRHYKNVQIFDFVENAQEFIQAHDIMLVPLLSGSGMRIKIMEALALGKPVITTTIGAEGINITNGKNIFIADKPEEMIQIIDFCTKNIQKCEEIGKNARKLTEKEYTREVISKDLSEFLFP